MLNQLRHQRPVTGRLGRHAHYVHVILNRLSSRFLRRLEQRADIDVEADIRKRGGDYLRTPVVSVLPELDHQQAWAAALLIGESRNLFLDFFELLITLIG